MTSFELVFSLITFVLSLALTHLLSGLVGVLRNYQRVRFSAAYSLWAWSALTVTIGNWAANWPLRSLTSWPAWSVLLSVALVIVQYVFCAFVTPEVPAQGPVDLAGFHEREHRRYAFALGVLCVMSLISNSAMGEAHFYAYWWRDNALSIVVLALAGFAFYVRPRWAQTLAAALIALLCTYFMVVVCNVVAA